MFRFILTVVFTAFIVLFFAQGSLIYYFEQRFHTDFGIEKSLKGTIFSKGEAIFEAFCVFIDSSVEIIKEPALKGDKPENSVSKNSVLENSENSKPENSISENSVLENSENSKPENSKNSKLENSILENSIQNNLVNDEIIAFNQNLKINIRNENNSTKTQAETLTKPADQKIHLKSGDGVLFIGDSLMQYIGMNAKKIFPSKNLKVTDLSKQSTGLIDRRSHSWHAVLENALKTDKNIKLVVVLMGANDVWGRSIEGKFRDVFTDEWQEFYKERVNSIYEISKNHGAKVLWLSMPCMKKPDFEKKTALLNSIYSSLSAQSGEYFLNTSDIMCLNGEYQTHIFNGTKKIKARQDDGIHMSNLGSALISDEILKRIEVE